MAKRARCIPLIDALIVDALERVPGRVPVRLGRICDLLGIKRGRGGRYSRAAYARYLEVSAALAKLQRAGVVQMVRGPSGGWRLARKAVRRG